MDKEKQKKKTLTISSNFKKRLTQVLSIKKLIETLTQSLIIKKIHSNHLRILAK